MEKNSFGGITPLILASQYGRLEVMRYLLEQGADRDKVDHVGWTSLHWAASRGHLDIAKLLMVYGADLNARDHWDQLPIDLADNEEIRQAIRDEPRRRMDEAPGKRATEQDRHPNAAAQKEDDDEQHNKQQEEVKADEGEVAEEDQDSEPSSDENND